jgi:sugar diacid utilization regulator
MAHTEGAEADGPEEHELAAFSRALLARLADGLDTLADQVGKKLGPVLEPYGTAVGQRVTALVGDALRELVPVWVAAQTRGEALDTQDYSPLERLGSELGAVGLAPDEIEACAATAAQCTLAQLVDHALTFPPSRLVVAGMALVLRDTLDFVLQAAKALARGYAGQQQDAVTHRVRAEHELLDDLLSGFFLDGPEMLNRATAIGHDLHVPHGILLAVVPATTAASTALPRLRAAQDALLAHVPGTLDVSLRRSPVPHAAALVPATTTDEWEHALDQAAEVTTDHGVVVLSAAPVVGPGVMHATYQEATRHLELAARVGAPGVVTPRDLVVYRALAGGPAESRALVHDVLGPVLARSPNKRRVLLATLEAMRTSNRLADVARALGITRKGLGYRLGLLRQLTGLDPADTSQRLQLDLAYRAYQLFGDEPPESEDDAEDEDEDDTIGGGDADDIGPG